MKSIKEVRDELIQQIELIDDLSQLELVQMLLGDITQESSDSPPKELWESLLKREAETKSQPGIPHEVVMSQIKAKYGI